MTGVSDEGLLAGMATGDLEAAAGLIRRLQSRVFGLALAIVGDRGIAEDVAQETFLRLWRHAAAYDPRKGSVRTWTLAITRNLAIDAVRLRRDLPKDPLLPWAAELSAVDFPEDAVAARDEVDKLREALARLPTEKRRAVLLAGLAGWTAREIAEADGIPLGTAKTRIRDGLMNLRAGLERQRGGG